MSRVLTLGSHDDMKAEGPTTPTMRCLQCNYILDFLPRNRCPECGRDFDPSDQATFRYLFAVDTRARFLRCIGFRRHFVKLELILILLRCFGLTTFAFVLCGLASAKMRVSYPHGEWTSWGAYVSGIYTNGGDRGYVFWVSWFPVVAFAVASGILFGYFAYLLRREYPVSGRHRMARVGTGFGALLLIMGLVLYVITNGIAFFD